MLYAYIFFITLSKSVSILVDPNIAYPLLFADAAGTLIGFKLIKNDPTNKHIRFGLIINVTPLVLFFILIIFGLPPFDLRLP